MDINAFSLPNIGLILMSLLLIIFLIYIRYTINMNASIQQQQNFKKPILRFTGIYFLYLILICFLASSGFFSVATNPPRMLLGFIPVIITAIIILRANASKSLSLLQFISPWLFIAVQSFRIIVEFILAALYKEKLVPVELTYHGRNFDIAIGLLAIPAAFIVYKKYAFAKMASSVFNTLGLISLINILTIAIPSVPSAFRIYEMNYLPTYFPGILILFLMPMAIYFHLLSIRQFSLIK